MKLVKLLLILFIFSNSAFANSPLILSSNEEGTDWTQEATNVPPLTYLDNLSVISYYQKNLMLIGDYGDSDNSYSFYSTDGGVKWISSLSAHKPLLMTTLAVNDEGWVIAGSTFGVADMSITGDIDNWRSIRIPYTECENVKKIIQIQSNDSTFLALTSCMISYPDLIRPTILTSANGLDWFRASINLPPEIQSEKASFNKSYWDGKQWYLLATSADNSPLLYTTSDLKTLHPIVLPKDINSMQSIAFDGEEWIATGTYNNNGKNMAVIFSSRGKAEEVKVLKKFPTPILKLNKITRNDKVWVAIGYSGQDSKTYPVILTSKNGLQWEQVTLPSKVIKPAKGVTLNDVVWDGNKWLVVGSYET
jgi:hypothetical protein